MSEAIDFNDLQQRHDQLLADYAHLKKAYEKALFEFEKLRRRLVGPTKEQVSTEQDAQLSLLAVAAATSRSKISPSSASSSTRQNAVLLAASAFLQIGEEVSEHVEHRAASLVRVQWVRPIFVDPGAPTSAAIDDASMPPAPARCDRCHFYIVVVPKEHLLYRFTATNKGEDVARVLQGISGHVHADAASVYHELYRQADDVVEVGCWAHARRKFFEALSRDRERAMIGIGFISLLYDALDVTTGIADREQRARAARPILARIFR